MIDRSMRDDLCEACSKEVANRECAHGILCDGCDEEIHGAVGAHCVLDVPSIEQVRVDEFHHRLKSTVWKLTCDVERDAAKFAEYTSTLNERGLTELADVLRLELLQVVKAVEEAK